MLFPHLFCYFCDICLGIWGDALSLICPSIERARQQIFGVFSSFCLSHPPYLLNYILFPQSYLLCDRLLFVLCLKSASGAVTCVSESPKPIMKTGRGYRADCLYIKILFCSLLPVLELKFVVALFFFILFVCVLSVLLYIASATFINFVWTHHRLLWSQFC